MHQQQDKQMAALNKEEIQLAEVKVSRISPSDSKEDKKKKIQQMLDRQAEWEDKKKKALHASHEPQGEHIDEGKCDGCTCPGCSPDGVGHQNPCIECGGHHKEEKKVSESMLSYGSASAHDGDDEKTAAARKRIYDASSPEDKKYMDANVIKNCL